MKTSAKLRVGLQKLKTKLCLFTRQAASFILPRRMTNRHKKNHLSNLFTQPNQTPLDVFIDVLINHNLNRLIRTGKAKLRDLAEAWEILFTEYCELSGSPQYIKIFNLSRQIGQQQSKILAIDLCIQVLSIRYSAACVTTLRKQGYNYKFDINNMANYNNDLNTVKIKSKTVRLTLEQALLAYQKLISENTGKQLTAQYFETQLVELSKFMGFRLNPKEITVSEYIAVLKRMEKEIEMYKKPHK